MQKYFTELAENILEIKLKADQLHFWGTINFYFIIMLSNV